MGFTLLVNHVSPQLSMPSHDSPAVWADRHLLAADDEQIPLDVVLNRVVLCEDHGARPLGRARCCHVCKALCAFGFSAGVVSPRRSSSRPVAALKAMCAYCACSVVGSNSKDLCEFLSPAEIFGACCRLLCTARSRSGHPLASRRRPGSARSRRSFPLRGRGPACRADSPRPNRSPSACRLLLSSRTLSSSWRPLLSIRPGKGRSLRRGGQCRPLPR